MSRSQWWGVGRPPKALILVQQLLLDEEGFSESPYYCTEGYPTIGIGLRIGPKDAPLSYYEQVMPKDVAIMYMQLYAADLYRNLDKVYPNVFCRLSPVRQAVLISMAYQMGLNGIKGFSRMWGAIADNNPALVVKEMLDSKWAREDTPQRATRHADYYALDRLPSGSN